MTSAVDIFGTLPGWLTLIAAAGIAWTLWRGSSGHAVGILRESNAVMVKRLEELELERKQLATTVGLLEARTNLEPMVGAVIEQFIAHEQRAQERHASTLRIMDLIAQRLGPDPNGQPAARRES